MIRKLITEQLVATGEPPELESIASSLKVSIAELQRKLREEPPLERLTGLSSAQAQQLLNHYDGFEMFGDEVRRTLTSFADTREKIRKIEKKSKK